ncbi:MAG: type II secretion system F family protein, partial [Candidatus Diapherotrites archaeon]
GCTNMIWIIRKLFPEDKLEKFENLLLNELNLSIEKLDSISKIFSAVASIAVTIIVYFVIECDASFMILSFLVTFFISYFLTIAIFGFIAEKKLMEKEASAAEALMHASLLPAGTPVEDVISYISKGNYALAKEFKLAEHELKKGASTSKALSSIENRCKSRDISYVVHLLKLAEVSGNLSPELFREAAGEMLEAKAILRERAALLTIQKITVILSSMLLVPFILGLLCSIARGFDLSYLEVLEMDRPNQAELIEASAIASMLYILELGFISSIFLGLQEGNQKKSAVYFALILPVSLIIFWNANAFSI